MCGVWRSGFVRAAIRALSLRPGAAPASYEDSGLSVYRFATMRDRGSISPMAYQTRSRPRDSGAIVAQARPDIVHLHARTAAVSERLVDVAHAAGARVVFTYHTPTASCARGTMMLFGETPCDGIIETKRCSACALAALGMPKPLARAAAVVPNSALHAGRDDHGTVEGACRRCAYRSDCVRTAALSRFHRQGRSRGRGIAMGERCAQAQRGARRKDYIVPSRHRRTCTGAAADGAARASGTAEDRLFWPDRSRQGSGSSGSRVEDDPQMRRAGRHFCNSSELPDPIRSTIGSRHRRSRIHD